MVQKKQIWALQCCCWFHWEIFKHVLNSPIEASGTRVKQDKIQNHDLLHDQTSNSQLAGSHICFQVCRMHWEIMFSMLVYWSKFLPPQALQRKTCRFLIVPVCFSLHCYNNFLGETSVELVNNFCFIASLLNIPSTDILS